jgi:hypothetical protein
MGGVSQGTLVRDVVAGRAARRWHIQMALDLAPEGSVIDASGWNGIELDVIGNNEEYGVHLRTDAVERPGRPIARVFELERLGGRCSLPC